MLYGDDGGVCGVATADVGISKSGDDGVGERKGELTGNFERGMELRARQVTRPQSLSAVDRGVHHLERIP